jgi:hypothetical protein
VMGGVIHDLKEFSDFPLLVKQSIEAKKII